MKVLHVINVSGFGGAEKLLLQLLPALQKNASIHCTILSKKGSNDAALAIEKELDTKGIRMYHIEYDTFNKSHINGKLKEQIKKEQYDLIHTHLKHADFLLALLKKKKQIITPVVSTMHGYRDSYVSKHGLVVKQSIYWSAYFIISKWIYRQLDGFILISGILSKFFNESGLIKGKPQQIIYHGYEICQIEADKQIEKQQYKIAIPGRLVKLKGHRFALDALKRLLPEFPDAQVHIYGTGPEEMALKKSASDNGIEKSVFFHGFVSDLNSRLAEASVVVVPSLGEGFGLVFLDAFDAKTPVVAFDVPAANEIVKDEYSGLLCRPYSVQHMTEQIKRIFNDDELSSALVRNGSLELRARFGMDLMVKNYLDFYQTLIQRSKNLIAG